MNKEISTEKAEQIFNDYSSYIYRIALFLTKSKASADDITQETLLQIFKKYHTYRPDRPIEPWIYKITVNTVRNTLRRQKWLSYMDQLPEQADGDLLDNRIVKNEEEAQLWQAIDNLTQKSKEVIILHYYSDMKLNEVAYTLGIPLGTCKSRLNSALNNLKHQLNQDHFNI